MNREELQRFFSEEIVDFSRINSLGNNCLYKVRLPTEERVVKEYSRTHMNNWPRGEREFESLYFLWERGFRNIPRPIVFDKERNIGVYSFEDGNILAPEQIQKEHILSLSDFLVSLHSLKVDFFPPASTAALHPIDYVLDIERRISFLQPEVDGSSSAAKDLFYRAVSKAERLIKEFRESFPKSELEKELSLDEQTLNFGDFGFHNVLISRDRYTFIDFEYFGRDDPVRELLGFVHHDKHLQINRELKQLFIDNYLEKTSASDKLKQRMRLADPLKGMTFALTYLNVISPQYISQQKGFGADIEKIINERLSKAEAKLEDLSFF